MASRSLWGDGESDSNLLGRNGDISALTNNFYSEYDERLAKNIVRRNKSLRDNLIGEGTHFSSYLYYKGVSMGLVVSIADEDFLRGLPSPREKFIANLKSLKKISNPLIPPIEVLSFDDELAYITPFASEPAEALDPCWGRLSDLKQNLIDQLGSKGLEIDDYIQIHCIAGRPIVIDWSDLQEIAP